MRRWTKSLGGIDTISAYPPNTIIQPVITVTKPASTIAEPMSCANLVASSFCMVIPFIQAVLPVCSVRLLFRGGGVESRI